MRNVFVREEKEGKIAPAAAAAAPAPAAYTAAPVRAKAAPPLVPHVSQLDPMLGFVMHLPELRITKTMLALPGEMQAMQACNCLGCVCC